LNLLVDSFTTKKTPLEPSVTDKDNVTMASSDTPGRHLSITGKVVDEGKAPTHTMEYSRPVPITAEQAAMGFDKKEEASAVADLRNISTKEVSNRQRISNVGLAASVLGVAFFIVKDKEIPRFYRSAMIGPFGLWFGYWISAKAGI